MKKVTIKWYTRNANTILRICERFGIRYRSTINGLQQAEIDARDWGLFLKTRDFGHFAICSEQT